MYLSLFVLRRNWFIYLRFFCVLVRLHLQPANKILSEMPSPTFAEKTKQRVTPLTSFVHPTEEQGIIFNHVEGQKLRDYLLAIYKPAGGAQNIIAASRVSGGKIILFLASREIVDKFQNDHGGFKLGNTFIPTRRLKAPTIRIILSNVSPIIPNTVIENLISNRLGLKMVSPISILRFSPVDDLFPHVISWRRQFYLPANTDLTKIPSTFTLDYAERTYRIFLTAGDFVCFKCHEKGHKAENCNNEIPFMDDEVEDTIDKLGPVLTPEPSILPAESFPPLKPTQSLAKSAPDPQDNVTQPPAAKRGPSTLESSIQSNEILLTSEDSDTELLQMAKPATKKLKKTKHNPNPETYLKSLILTPTEIEAITAAVTHIQQTKYPNCDFTAKQLINFLPTLRGNPNKLHLARAFSSNMDHLLFTLEAIKPQLETGTKRTITSLTKALSKDIPYLETSDET